MGRGRAKAKQAKVARQLKYAGASTDLDALRRELVTDSSSDGVELDDEFDDDSDVDSYAGDYPAYDPHDAEGAEKGRRLSRPEKDAG
jgi:hypothetical protein